MSPAIEYGLQALGIIVVVAGTVWTTFHAMFRERLRRIESDVSSLEDKQVNGDRVETIEEDVDSIGKGLRDLRTHVHKEIGAAHRSLGEQVGRLTGRLESIAENQEKMRQDIAVLRDRSDRAEETMAPKEG